MENTEAVENAPAPRAPNKIVDGINYGGVTTGINVKAVEERYNAKYIGDFCLMTKNGWSDYPASVFWQETPPKPEYSNYVALFIKYGYEDEDAIYITSGASAFEKPIEGFVADNGEIIYSRFRHDFRSSSDGSVTVDGGRDYTRVLWESGNPPKRVYLVPEKDKLVVRQDV